MIIRGAVCFASTTIWQLLRALFRVEVHAPRSRKARDVGHPYLPLAPSVFTYKVRYPPPPWSNGIKGLDGFFSFGL